MTPPPQSHFILFKHTKKNPAIWDFTCSINYTLNAFCLWWLPPAARYMSRLTSTCAASLALTHYIVPGPVLLVLLHAKKCWAIAWKWGTYILHAILVLLEEGRGRGGGGAYLRESYVLHLKYLHPNYRYRCMHAVTHITAYPILTFLCTYCKNRCMVVLSEFPKDF